MEFREAWQKVADLEGETFRTERGEEFTYRFRKTYIVVSAGDISVPRTNFEKVFRRRRTESENEPTPVQGQRYIQAIFNQAGIVENPG